MSNFASGFQNTMSAISPFTSLAGGIIGSTTSAYGAYGTALAENYSKQYNALTSRYTASILEQKAEIYRKLGETEKQETIQQYDALRSQQRAEYGASGVDVNFGSAMTTQLHSVKQGVYEGQKRKWERDMQAWELDVEAQQHLLSAQFNESNIRNPWVPAVSAAVGGLTNAFAQFGQWKPNVGSGIQGSSVGTAQTTFNSNWSSASAGGYSPAFSAGARQYGDGYNIPSMGDYVTFAY